MVRFVSMFFVAVLFSQNILASEARMLSLGQGRNGSLYLEDTRMIFLNPALLHRQKDFANFEMGSSTVGTTPNAEGGFFRNDSGHKWGFQLGRETNAYTKTALLNAYIGTALPSPNNSFEVQYAGGADWGASVVYGSAQDNTDIPAGGTTAYPNKKAQTLELRGGLDRGNWHAFANLDLMTTAENETAAGTAQKLDGKPSLTAGGAMDMDGDRKLYGSLVYWNWSGTTGAGVPSRDASITNIGGGIVQFLKPEASTKFFYSGGLMIENSKLAALPGGTDDKSEKTYIPVAVGLENEASDWLTLRASVTQKVLIDQTKTSVTDQHAANSTSVAAGAGFKWKKLSMDATLAAGSTDSANGKINGTDLLTNASLTYLF